MRGEKSGVVLFAHGSDDPGWKIPFINIERRLAEKLGDNTLVRTAFLRQCEPDIFTVADEMNSGHCQNITIAPVFLAAGNHVMKDFPAIAKSLEEKYPNINFEWTDAIGQWPEAQEALAMALMEKVTGQT
ncbi:hypothetical protein MNBD_NITROSPINAE02-759 [hydrothermal vent metagenome]|uniref:Sirohydrochlorin cobaltochelatase n=1 Tax=hydrothermal vent metagenome TaxID=652676 RepID=A0A3B1BNG6_9ZZZZ